jgi:hypothetical protein
MFLLPNGRLSPQFMHLFPCLLAMGYSVAGVWGALFVNPILGAIAVLAMYRFSSLLIGWRWAIAATVLMAVNPAQVWQSKFATAELLAQVLLLAGSSLVLDSPRRRHSSLFAALAGFMFGLSFLARYDIAIFLAPFFLLLVFLKSATPERRSVLAFVLTLAAMGIHAWLHMSFVAPCYHPLPGVVLPLLVACALTGTAVFAWAPTVRGRWMMTTMSARYADLARICLSLGVVIFAIFAWYVRPRLTVDGRVLKIVGAVLDALGRRDVLGALSGADAFNAQILTSIFGEWGALLACGGLLALIWRVRDRAAVAWLVASLTTTVVLVTCVFHDHFMMWVSRRYIPVVVPLLAIGVATAAKEAYGLLFRRSRVVAAAISAGLVTSVVAVGIHNTAAMSAARDWPGLHAWCRDTARRIPREALVFCDQPGFAAALRFVYGVNAYEIRRGLDCVGFFERHREHLDGLRVPVLALTMRQPRTSGAVSLVKLGTTVLVSSIQDQPPLGVPTRSRRRGGVFAMYRPNWIETTQRDGSPP